MLMISVIIPSYNRARTILASVRSVLQQTYTDVEVWVVDDCSTDHTEEVLAGIHDDRLHYFRLEKNSGACAARNAGIEKATGSYIAFNDSDDQWHKDKLEKQLAFLKENQADVVTCAMAVKDEQGNFLHDFPQGVAEGPVTYQQLLAYNCTSTQVMMGKAECFKSVRFDPAMPRMQDWDELLRLVQRYKVCFQKEILVDTFVQHDSITTHPEKGVVAMDKLFAKHQEAILSHKDIARSFFLKKASFVCKAGGNPIEEMKLLHHYAPSSDISLRLFLCRLHLYRRLYMKKNRADGR